MNDTYTSAFQVLGNLALAFAVITAKLQMCKYAFTSIEASFKGGFSLFKFNYVSFLFDGGEPKVWKLEINDSNQDIKNLFHVNFNDVSVVTPR